MYTKEWTSFIQALVFLGWCWFGKEKLGHDSPSGVPALAAAAAAASPGNLLEMQIIRLHPSCAESATLKEGPAFCALISSSIDSAACSSSRTTGLGYTKATNSKYQWLNIVKAYLLLTLNAHLLLTRESVHHGHPGIQADGAASILESHWWSWPRKKMWGITNWVFKAPPTRAVTSAHNPLPEASHRGTSNWKRVEKGFTHCGIIGRIKLSSR